MSKRSSMTSAGLPPSRARRATPQASTPCSISSPGGSRATGATFERLKIDDRFGDLLKVRSAPGGGANAGILVLSHVDTVHPVGTLAGPLPLRRDGDRL